MVSKGVLRSFFALQLYTHSAVSSGAGFPSGIAPNLERDLLFILFIFCFLVGLFISNKLYKKHKRKSIWLLAPVGASFISIIAFLVVRYT